MAIIIISILAAYFVLMAWTWQSLEYIEKKKKIIFILVGILIFYIITLIIFNMSKNGINYQNESTEKTIKTILVSLFTAINGIIFIPYIAKIFLKVKENDIEKSKLNRKIIILIILFVICMYFECGYLKDIQKGIINVYNSMLK